MKIKKILGISLFLVSGVTLVACNKTNSIETTNSTTTNSTTTTTNITTTTTTTTNTPVDYSTEINQTFGFSGETETTKFHFKDSYVSEESTKFNKDLALFSLGSALSTENRTITNKFYTDLGFDKIEYYGDSDTSDEGIGYSFAHKKIDNSDLVVISARGVGYSTEWKGNFDIGITGNHKNFQESADKIYNRLTTYLSNNKDTSTLKLLITGYSRGAAVSNVLSHKLMTLDNKLTADSNLYSYTFATPRGVLKADNINYKNVFNIINSADLVPYVAPDNYGFTRCGTDIDIYNEKADEILISHNNKYVLPKFSKFPDVEKETETTNFIINTLTKYYPSDDENKQYSLNTRQEFVERYQPAISFVFDTFFTMKDSTKTKIKTAIQEIAEKNMFDLIPLVTNGENLYNFLKPFLEEDKGDAYSSIDAILLDSCNTFTNLIQNSGAPILILAMPQYSNSVIRTVYMHTSLVYNILFDNYTYNV